MRPVALLRSAISLLAVTALVWNGKSGAAGLEKGFASPPPEARLRAYWWWLNGNVTQASITRDLEEMAAKGFGGALICDAGGAEQDGNAPVPHGPTFFTSEWRSLYRHAVHEAARLGLELSLNIQSGWNLGGPFVKAEEAPKKLVWTELTLVGPGRVVTNLAEPRHSPEFYRDVAVVAYPVIASAAPTNPPPLRAWAQKALHRALSFSAPVTTPLLEDEPDQPGEARGKSDEVLELTALMSGEGLLSWQVPPGTWTVLRFGCTLNDHCRVSTCSDGWQGYALDPFDAEVFRAYWQRVVTPLIDDAGPLAGRTLKYLHTDSWEVEVANWTPTLREEFRARRGYDLARYLPVIAGHIIDGRHISNRFLHDFRKTMGDLAVDNHYRSFVEGAHQRGLSIHPESGGPHAVPVDSLRCLGMDDAPMSEFWAWSWRHRVGDTNRFFVKQPASAAHTYGRKLVLAEGFTTIGPHWQETLWDNLKPAFDQASCEGLNRLVWHAFTCSPAEMGVPGQEYFAGTHFNPNSTWWSRSQPFLAYLNRCQYLLQQGLFVADALYYYGDHVPNFAQLKRSDPAGLLPGYDYDVATEEVILKRVQVRNGRLRLPDGMSYRVLMLPRQTGISLPVLRRVRELVRAGATVCGPRPEFATGLESYPASDAEVNRLAEELWGKSGAPGTKADAMGKGRVFAGLSAREVLQADGVRPDFEILNQTTPNALDYIHRRAGRAEIYFVANRSNAFVQAECVFRVHGLAPELWDPVTGRVRPLPARGESKSGVSVTLEFSPYGSWFVVFRHPAKPSGNATARNFPRFTPLQTLRGNWRVHFDPQWGGPDAVEFDRLMDWTDHSEVGIRYYSGTATYRKSFDLPADQGAQGRQRLFLDLGQVRQLAEVRLNGKPLGVLWAYPFRVDVTEAVRSRDNELEIDVVNFWPNRVIGDQSLPAEQRRTRTNVRKLVTTTPLVSSGLLGPVRILTVEADPAGAIR